MEVCNPSRVPAAKPFSDASATCRPRTSASAANSICFSSSAELEMTVHAIEILPDHVRLFVEADPTRPVAEIVKPP
jgi:REP element-mobilizing transposase RayT